MPDNKLYIEEKEFEVEWKKRIPSHLIEDEEFLRPKYEPQHPLELETKKFISFGFVINIFFFNFFWFGFI